MFTCLFWSFPCVSKSRCSPFLSVHVQTDNVSSVSLSAVVPASCFWLQCFPDFLVLGTFLISALILDLSASDGSFSFWASPFLAQILTVKYFEQWCIYSLISYIKLSSYDKKCSLCLLGVRANCCSGNVQCTCPPSFLSFLQNKSDFLWNNIMAFTVDWPCGCTVMYGIPSCHCLSAM